MDNNDDELCPCGSGKPFDECCNKEYEQANQREQAKDKLKQAMSDPKKAKELKELMEKFKNK